MISVSQCDSAESQYLVDVQFLYYVTKAKTFFLNRCLLQQRQQKRTLSRTVLSLNETKLFVFQIIHVLFFLYVHYQVPEHNKLSSTLSRTKNPHLS